MNIIEATKEMQKGKEVYRLGWQSLRLPIHLWKDGQMWWGKSVSTIGDRTNSDYTFMVEDLLADDWVSIEYGDYPPKKDVKP